MYRILIVEDDYLQAELIENALRREPEFTQDAAEIERLSTEKQFHLQFEAMASNPPDVIVMDVMLRWDDPAPNMEPPPPEIKKEGFYRAGLRNERMLTQDPRTSNIPVVLYTLIADIDLEGIPGRPGVSYLPKDSRLDPLVQLIRSLIVVQSG